MFFVTALPVNRHDFLGGFLRFRSHPGRSRRRKRARLGSGSRSGRTRNGGGVIDAYPDFAQWTAGERIEEARSTGAEALVTACPWCERNFLDTVSKNGKPMKVFDVVELVQQAL